MIGNRTDIKVICSVGLVIEIRGRFNPLIPYKARVSEYYSGQITVKVEHDSSGTSNICIFNLNPCYTPPYFTKPIPQYNTAQYQALKVYEEAVSAGVLTSVYQRPVTLTPGLKAQPVWTGLELPAVDLSAQDKEDIVQAIIYKGNYSPLF